MVSRTKISKLATLAISRKIGNLQRKNELDWHEQKLKTNESEIEIINKLKINRMRTEMIEPVTTSATL